MATNKLTTLGYFLKRLRNSGYYAFKLFNEYGYGDCRLWTVLIDPKVSSVFCTAYSGDPVFGDREPFLELSDGGQFFPTRLRIKTQSFEVFVEHLVRCGINNKSKEYSENGLNKTLTNDK